MAFGIKRPELVEWKRQVAEGEKVVFLTHYWLHPRFPEVKTITKAGCANLALLEQWGRKYQLRSEWIHKRDKYPHFDLIGDKQVEILLHEVILDQIERFHLK